MEKIIFYGENSCKYSKDDIKIIINLTGRVLKDTERSFVKVVEFKGEKIVVKIPIDKNKRKAERVATFFRKCEAVRVLESMEKLKKIGVITNEPIASIEIKNNKMTIESIMIYGYLEGIDVKEEDAEKVINIIRKIHKFGYIHSDTQKKNFIKIGKEIGTIDAKLKRKIFGKISENLEYIGYSVDNNKAYNFININSIWYKIAKSFYELFRLKRRFKSYCRGKNKKK